MIPDLGGVVEHARIAGVVGRLDDGFERLGFVIRALDRRVQLVDVSLVMLAVMEFERASRDMRLECVGSSGRSIDMGYSRGF